jgi:hypothetical protein
MRKRLITPIPQNAPPLDEGWLDLDDAAVVEVTSEEKEYPVESALVSGEMRGWRAADSGTQTIRLIFDDPQRLTRISLVFEETETERTQEFVLRWSPDGGRISVPLRQHARSRNIRLNSRMSPFLNWSLSLTSVEERLAPRSRVCAYLRPRGQAPFPGSYFAAVTDFTEMVSPLAVPVTLASSQASLLSSSSAA